MATNPNCNDKTNPELDFLEIKLPSPAKRALRNAGIDSLKKLAEFSEQDLLELHRMGKTTIPKLKEILEKNNLKFKNEEQYFPMSLVRWRRQTICRFLL